MRHSHRHRKHRLLARRRIGDAGYGSAARTHRISFERLEDRSLLSATPQLVKDINAVPLSSYPNSFITVGKTTFLMADDDIHGTELWKTDGTAAGTNMLKDIRGGAFYSGVNDRSWPASSDAGEFTDFNGRLFFVANDGVHGRELWVSNGTSAGTVLFKNINPNGSASPDNLTVVGGTLYFTAYRGAGGEELWKSDGTSAGTSLVTTIEIDRYTSLGQFTAVKDKLFFVANDTLHGAELWMSDGTAAGTKTVRDIRPDDITPNEDVVRQSSFPSNLTAVGSRLYFTADNGIHGRELWRSDGTEAGTRLVKNITTRAGSTFGKLIDFNGSLLFSVNDVVHGAELWKSNGAAAGTVLVKDINPGSDSSSPDQFLVIGKRLYFTADNGIHGTELWRSDGTEVGTRLVKNITTGGSSSTIGGLVNLDGRLYFAANDGVHGSELWTSNGAASGTSLVVDINGNSDSSLSYWFGNLTSANGKLLMVADDGVHSFELWTSDGTASGTSLVEDILARTPSSSPANLTDVNGTLFFTAADQSGVTGLWKSTGSDAGTVFLKEVRLSANFEMINVDGTLYYSTARADGSAELWKSDGTAEGTVLVRRIEPIDRMMSMLLPETSTAAAAQQQNNSQNAASASVALVGGTIATLSPTAFITDLTVVNGQVLFVLHNGPLNRFTALWKSDGTTIGTTAIDGAIGPNFDNLINVGGIAFFSDSGKLYQSNGTPNGTMLVKDFGADGAGYVTRVANVNGMLYVAIERGTNVELWRSNGTSNGTVMLKSFVSPTMSHSGYTIDGLTDVSRTLFFRAEDAVDGAALWKSDGTVEGTVLVKKVFTRILSSGQPDLTSMNGKLFFTAWDDQDVELWISDGTTDGTKMLKDIYPGATVDEYGTYPNQSLPSDLTNINGTLYFSANDDVHGRELWRSDGTPAGTVRVKSLYPGDGSSSPTDFTYSGGKMFFTADDFTHGRELWSLDVGPAVPTTVNPVRAGDLDGDGDVDGADFVVWQTNFGRTGGATRSTGDADGDGDVDGADFVVWQTHFS